MKVFIEATPCTIIIGTLFLAATQAAAQSSDVATTPDASASGGLEEVLVTAQKRSESLQRAAASIQVIQEDALVRQGVTDLRALEMLNTGIQLTKQQTHAQIFVRGIGTTQSAPNTDAAVAVTLNGAVVASELTGAALFDVERTELLSGPQGTLYGTNAAGGVISVSLRKPGKTFAADGLVEAGNYDFRHIQAGLDVPLGEKVQVRTVGHFIDRDGFSNNGLNDEKSRAGRITLAAQPSENLSMLVWGGFTHMGGEGDAGYEFPFRGGREFYQPFPVCCTQLAANPADRSRGRDADFTQVAGELNWDLGTATLTWIPSYQRIDIRGRLVLDAGGPETSPTVLQQTVLTKKSLTSQELRLAGTSGAFDWLGGLYYFRQQWDETRDTGPGKNYNVAPIHRSYAAFGQLKYSLSDSFRLVGGARYAEDEKSCEAEHCAQFIANVRTPFDVDLDWNHIDWKAGFESDISANSMLYGTVQTGYLAGGFQIRGGSTSPSNEVKPEKLLSFSLGSKNRFFNDRMTLNTEAFYYKYKDYQTSVLIFTGAASGQSLIYNADRTRIYGIESNAQFLLTEQDRLSLGLTLADAEFTDFKVPQNSLVLGQFTTDYSGFTMPFAPRTAATLGYEHTWHMGSGGRLVADVLTAYNSGHWATFSHGVQQCLALSVYPPTDACLAGAPKQDDFTQTNASLTYYGADDRWSIGVWVKNLEDEAIVTSGAEQRPGTAIVSNQAPRMYGARATFQF